MQVYATIRYDKGQQIGVGQGMNSTVYLAHDPHLLRELAVKEIDQTTIAGNGWDAYHREAQAMFAARHENVVLIIYACLTPTHVCLAMPYYRSGSLQDRISAGPPSMREAYRIADGLLAALSQVHVANLLHFDVKPSNVLFSDTDEPLISDFGQSRLMDPRGLSAAPKMYPLGIPPEALTYGVGTVESDIYQAGLTLYRMFNGDPFFKNQVTRLRGPLKQAIQKGRLPNRNKFLPHVPAGIRRVIRKALRLDPADRYHSAIEFQDALGRVPMPTAWETELRPRGEVIWRARRDRSRCDLEVRRLANGTSGRWKVEVYMRRGTQVRRKRVNDLWACDLTALAADRHLRSVFDELG